MKRKTFTFVELMIVMAIIAIITAIFFPSLLEHKTRMKEKFVCNHYGVISKGGGTIKDRNTFFTYIEYLQKNSGGNSAEYKEKLKKLEKEFSICFSPNRSFFKSEDAKEEVPSAIETTNTLNVSNDEIKRLTKQINSFKNKDTFYLYNIESEKLNHKWVYVLRRSPDNKIICYNKDKKECDNVEDALNDSYKLGLKNRKEE